jgi:thioester reductase-like protein
VAGVDIQVKRGSADNELTRYRYDVVVYKTSAPVRSLTDVPSWAWAQCDGLGGLHTKLTSQRPVAVRITGIPRAGVIGDVNVEAGLAAGLSLAEALAQVTTTFDTVIPEQLHSLGEAIGLHVAVTWGTQPGTLDAVFIASTDPQHTPLLAGLYLPPAGALQSSHANDPHTNTKVNAVRQRLSAWLPEYMVPAHIVVLDEFPLTSSGKLDRKALPAPVFTAAPFQEPQTPTEKIVAGAFAEVLGIERVGLDDDFFALGGDSLSAMRLIAAINSGLDAGISVRAVFEAPSVRSLIQQLGKHASSDSFASVHGRDATQVHASDLTLDKFVDATTLAAAPTLPGPSAEVRTVLLTGATGFLGRYLVLEWLERMELFDGTLICLVRAKSDQAARQRLEKTFDSGDPQLLVHFQELAADHLQVIAGDKSETNLGLDEQTWQRLADTVDLIVDSAALVNAILPYSELFGPNVVGTAELVRIALTTKIKPYIYVSTGDVGRQIEQSAFTEDADIRAISPTRATDGGYANSKWAGEVLLREANDLCALPVAVFRCGMILADTTYAGQLNVSDMFTRTILSVVATGSAPGSFYQLDTNGNRQRAHFDGLPVEFVAEAIATLGTQLDTSLAGFQTYHVMNPHDDGIGLDEYVDWLIEAGYPIQRISDIGEWLQRFEAGLRALPDRRRQHSLLWTSPLHNSNPLHNSIHFQVAEPRCGSAAPTDRFRAGVQEAKIGPNKNNPDIPHVSPAIIIKYVTDLQLLGLLARPPIRGDDPRRSICSMPRVRSRCKPMPSSSFGLMQDSTELD